MTSSSENSAKTRRYIARRWRGYLPFLVLYCPVLSIAHFIRSGPDDLGLLVALLVGVAAGFTLAKLIAEPCRYDVVLDESSLLGPVRRGLSIIPTRVSLADIDLARSRMSYWCGDIIKTRDGRKILLNRHYLGTKQIADLFARVDEAKARETV